MNTWVLLISLTLGDQQLVARHAVDSEAMCHKAAQMVRAKTPAGRVTYICRTLDQLSPEVQATVKGL